MLESSSSLTSRKQHCRSSTYKPKGTPVRSPLKGGDYLLFRFRSTIGVIRFNFSVRNGKRWSPYAVITLVSSVPSFAFRFRFSLLFGFPLPLFLLLIKLSLLFGSDGDGFQSDPAGENTA